MDLSGLVDIRIDARALGRDTDALFGRIERGVWDGLTLVAERTAEAARASHWYQNRTGDLEASTRALESEGDVWSDHASSAVAATMPYARFVDARQRILEPAWDAVSAEAEGAFEEILAQACRG